MGKSFDQQPYVVLLVVNKKVNQKIEKTIVTGGSLLDPSGRRRRAVIFDGPGQKSPLQRRRCVLSFANPREYGGLDLVTQGISC